MRSPLRTVSSMENPCSARSASGARPSVMIAQGTVAPNLGPGRLAGPWSGMKRSVTLSMIVVISTESTGSRSIRCTGSTSCRTAGDPAAGL